MPLPSFQGLFYASVSHLLPGVPGATLGKDELVFQAWVVLWPLRAQRGEGWLFSPVCLVPFLRSPHPSGLCSPLVARHFELSLTWLCIAI